MIGRLEQEACPHRQEKQSRDFGQGKKEFGCDEFGEHKVVGYWFWRRASAMSFSKTGELFVIHVGVIGAEAGCNGVRERALKKDIENFRESRLSGGV